MTWLTKSLIAMFCALPFMFAFNFFGKNFNMRPEITMLMWMLGSTIGIGTYTGIRGLPIVWLPALIVLTGGIIFGTIFNVLMSQAIFEAPNPALATSVTNLGNVATYFSIAVLAAVLPKYFYSVEFSWINICGILLTVIGTGLIAYKN